jgi:biopolymer transport protein ExbD
MKESARAKRIKRHYKRGKQQSKLNLVSLMDIFTILVFFLMVNSSSDVQVLNQDNAIKLPESKAEAPPADVLALIVTDDSILVNGRVVTALESFRSFDGKVEPALQEELNYQSARASSPAPDAGRPITILADRDLPYDLLKKIMSTCVDAGYASISLAVNQKPEQGA